MLSQLQSKISFLFSISVQVGLNRIPLRTPFLYTPLSEKTCASAGLPPQAQSDTHSLLRKNPPVSSEYSTGSDPSSESFFLSDPQGTSGSLDTLYRFFPLRDSPLPPSKRTDPKARKGWSSSFLLSFEMESFSLPAAFLHPAPPHRMPTSSE